MSESGTSYNDETIQQLLDQLEPMQTEIEQLTQERDNLQRRLRELESQQQTLSSENSKYRSELQKMADKIVRLNESDKILQDNNRLQAEIKATKQQADQRVRKAREEAEAAKAQAQQDSNAALLTKKCAEQKEANTEKTIRERVQTEKEAMKQSADEDLRKRREKLDRTYQTWFVLTAAIFAANGIYLIFKSVRTLCRIPGELQQLVGDVLGVVYADTIDAMLFVGSMLRTDIVAGIGSAVLWCAFWFLQLYLLLQLLQLAADFYQEAKKKPYNALALGTILLTSMILSLTYYEVQGTSWLYVSCWMVGFMILLLLYYWEATITAVVNLAGRIMDGVSRFFDQLRG